MNKLLDRGKKGAVRRREEAKSYDELVDLASAALRADERTVPLVERLRFHGKPQVLCAFLTATSYAEIRKKPDGSKLTAWDFLLELSGVSEKTLAALPADLQKLAESVRATAEALQKIRGGSFDPGKELKRCVPGETDEERSEFAEAGAKLQALPELLRQYAECLEEQIQQRRSVWGHKPPKLGTLSKALVTRYVRENSRTTADGTPAPFYKASARLLEIVSISLDSRLLSPTPKALQMIDKRARKWADEKKRWYDTVYDSLIRRYSEP
jgi:hypothetical protein